MPAGWKWSLAFLPGVLACFAWMGGLFGGNVPYWGATYLQFQPWLSLVAETYRSGAIPFWNPSAGFGAPLAANPQALAFSTTALLAVLMPAERAIGLGLLFHALLASAGATLLARRVGVSWSAAGIAGVVFPLGLAYSTRTIFPPLVFTFAWLPLAVAVWPQVFVPRRLLFPAVVLAAAWYDGGHPQAWSIVALASVIFGTVQGGRHWRGVAASAGVIALALGLAAPQAVPALELFLQSSRTAGLPDVLVRPYDPPPIATLLLLLPDVFGTPISNSYSGPVGWWEWSVFSGAVTLALAFFARDHRRYAVTLLVAGLALAYLPGLPVVGDLFRWLAGGPYLRGSGRFLILVQLALAVLAAAGLERAQNGIPRKERLRVLLVGIGALVGGGIAVAYAFATLTGGVVPLGVSVLFRAIALLLAGVALLMPKWRTVPLVVIVIAELLPIAYNATPLAQPRVYEADPPSQVRVVADPVFVGTFFREFPLGSFRSAVGLSTDLPNRAALGTGRDLLPYDPIRLKDGEHLVTSALAMTNSVTIMSRIGLSTTLPVAGSQSPEPYASLRRGATIISDDDAIQRLADPRFAYTTTVLLADRPPIPAGEPEIFDEADSIELRTRTATRIEIETRSSEPGFLTVQTSAYPGWEALVDGYPAPAIRADVAMTAVPVAPGIHTVTLFYQPKVYILGLAVAALSLVLWGVLAVFTRRRG